MALFNLSISKSTDFFRLICLFALVSISIPAARAEASSLNAPILKFASGNAAVAANRPALIMEYYVP